MKITYTKVDGRIFSIYSEKMADMSALLFDDKIEQIECFYITQREKQTLNNFFENNYIVRNVDSVCSVRVHKK
jgi:hypothetical protein